MGVLAPGIDTTHPGLRYAVLFHQRTGDVAAAGKNSVGVHINTFFAGNPFRRVEVHPDSRRILQVSQMSMIGINEIGDTVQMRIKDRLQLKSKVDVLPLRADSRGQSLNITEQVYRAKESRFEFQTTQQDIQSIFAHHSPQISQ